MYGSSCCCPHTRSTFHALAIQNVLDAVEEFFPHPCSKIPRSLRLLLGKHIQRAQSSFRSIRSNVWGDTLCPFGVLAFVTAKRNAVFYVVVHDMSRFSRQMEDQVSLLADLKHAGVQLVS